MAITDFDHIKLYSTNNWREISEFVPFDPARRADGLLHDVDVGNMAFSPDGKLLAVGAASGGDWAKPFGPPDPLKVFTLDHMQKVASLSGFSADFGFKQNPIVWSRHENTLVFLSADGKLNIWRPGGKQAPSSVLVDRSATGIALSPDQTLIAVNYADGIRIFAFEWKGSRP